MSNRLIHESSPYLQQHAHNPVDWYPWGDEALSRAKKENRMIFLSIGYSSCHWCHVMERESFEDPKAAKVLNEHFVPIKVDREERPDIDAVYMEAVQMMTGQGGWPLNVWLTPDLIPVFGGTYFPPQPMHGRPSFMQILERLFDVFQNQPDKVAEQTGKIRQALQQDLLSQIAESDVNDQLFSDAAAHFAQQFDKTDGGFAPAPKFPMAMGISFLLKYGDIKSDANTTEMALLSLEKMICGGIYDQIGGGFHRYSVDAKWLVPHFEKMLYDNALLLSTISDAWLVSRKSVFRETAGQTIHFLCREMQQENGGFFSALDADSEGEEGKFYVWDKKEITKTLGPDEAEIFCRAYQITDSGNWEGVNIPHLSKPIDALAEEYGMQPDDLKKRLHKSRQKLLTERENRVRPGLDDKVITAWNAMLLKSLCKAGRAFQEPEWITLAERLATFLRDELIINGTVRRYWKNGASDQPGFLDDNALLAEAFVHVFEVTGDAIWLETADNLCQKLLSDYYDAMNHGFYFTSTEHETLISRNRDLFDNAVPSGSSAAIAALWRTGMYTGIPAFTEAARKSLKKLCLTASRHATSFGYFLDTALQIHLHKEEVIISGDEPRPFLEYFNENSAFNRLLAQIQEPNVPNYPPLKGKKKVNENTACYVCRDFSCKSPVTDIRSLDELR